MALAALDVYRSSAASHDLRPDLPARLVDLLPIVRARSSPPAFPATLPSM